MISIGLFIGSYLYCLLILGFAGLLYKNSIILTTIIFSAIAVKVWTDKIKHFQLIKIKHIWKLIQANKTTTLLIILITLQILVNILGAISPETSFDALWYHLTLAKIYAANHKIIHVPGGLLYYSDM